MKIANAKMVAVLGAALLITTGALAQGKGSGSGERQGMRGDMGSDAPVLSMMLIKALDKPEFVQRVGLSESQVSKLKDLAEQQKATRENSKAMLEPLQKQLTDALNADSPNIASVETLIDKIGYERIESQKQGIRSMLEMKNVLTKEQTATIKELVKEYGPKRMGDDSGKKGRGNWKKGSSNN